MNDDQGPNNDWFQVELRRWKESFVEHSAKRLPYKIYLALKELSSGNRKWHSVTQIMLKTGIDDSARVEEDLEYLCGIGLTRSRKEGREKVYTVPE